MYLTAELDGESAIWSDVLMARDWKMLKKLWLSIDSNIQIDAE